MTGCATQAVFFVRMRFSLDNRRFRDKLASHQPHRSSVFLFPAVVRLRYLGPWPGSWPVTRDLRR